MADIILPEPSEGYEYVIVPKKKELLIELREKRDALKTEIDSMTRPLNADLIELGKIYHPYFILDRELDYIKNQINQIQNNT